MLDTTTASIYYPTANSADKEAVFIFECQRNNKTEFVLSSNFFYELWVDDQILGTGGQRCVENEAYANTWEITSGDTIRVKLHWLNQAKMKVYYRCVFKDVFLIDFDNTNQWICYHDTSIKFADKICSQLMQQNIVLDSSKVVKTNIINKKEPSDFSWKIRHLPVKSCQLVPVTPKLLSSHVVKANRTVDPNNKKIPDSITTFNPLRAKDIIECIRDKRYYDLKCDTYDLGYIGLYKFSVTAGDGPCVLCCSEVGKFEDMWSTPNRKKVHMADAYTRDMVKLGDAYDDSVRDTCHIELRGCRYICLLYSPKNSTRPSVKAWRSEYPFDWKELDANMNQTSKDIIGAIKNNLIACVDGGVVDTCWRERAQWTGDARMSAMALKSLTGNPEIIKFVLQQIASSYDNKTGLVQGAWPIKEPGYKLEMPTYSLAFCLTVIENIPDRTDALYKTVWDSVEFWKQNYIKDGLLQCVPGWNFIDWDFDDASVVGRGNSYNSPNCICNVWFDELCCMLGVESDINHKKFNKNFWNETGYKLYSGDSYKENIHATTTVLSCSHTKLSKYTSNKALEYLMNELQNNFDSVKARVTAYYAYFIAKALHNYKQNSTEFIHKYYGPIAQEFGTIYEKTSGNASLAHGWSVGVASLLLN